MDQCLGGLVVDGPLVARGQRDHAFHADRQGSAAGRRAQLVDDLALAVAHRGGDQWRVRRNAPRHDSGRIHFGGQHAHRVVGRAYGKEHLQDGLVLDLHQIRCPAVLHVLDRLGEEDRIHGLRRVLGQVAIVRAVLVHPADALDGDEVLQHHSGVEAPRVRTLQAEELPVARDVVEGAEVDLHPAGDGQPVGLGDGLEGRAHLADAIVAGAQPGGERGQDAEKSDEHREQIAPAEGGAAA